VAVMPIPDDWDGEQWCCHVVEWPFSEQWTAILLGLITTPQRGRFWDGRTGTITDAQAVGLQIFQRNLLEECDMGCLEDLANAISSLALSVSTSISNAGGCGCTGTGGSGIFEAEPETFQDDGTTFPNGYDTRLEYSSAKCDLAAYIINRWVDDLTRLRQIDASGKAASALVPLLSLSFLTPVPFDDLLGLAGVVLALVAISISAFVDACGELIAWLQALDVCLIYTAPTVEAAKTNLQTDLDSQTFTQDTLTKLIFTYLLNFDALNVLYGDKPVDINLDQIPAGDCDTCEYDCDSGFSQEIGTGPSIAEGYYSEPFVSEPNGGLEYIQVTSFKVGLPIKFVSLTGWVTSGDPHDFRIASGGDGTAGDLYNSGTPPSFPIIFDPGPTGNIAFVFSGAGTNQFELQLNCGHEE